MEITYNIPSILTEAFGVRGLAVYNTSDGESNSPNLTFNGADIINSENADQKMSAMGTPIVFPWKLMAGTYKSYDDDGNVIDVVMSNDFEMPLATLVTARRAKIMSRTRTVASKGTVKEAYGWDDWHLSIKGVLFNDPGHSFKTALEQKEELLNWENIADSISVSGELFTMKDIYRIAIKEISFQQLQGKPNLIPFTITAYSDEPLEILLK